ncbi:D-alanyl-D-alanine carboxypeptidase family protein [Tissierella praeacuta]|uniref:D-alanyl-D-alanine carboxypeptidase family protein n=1 Tax=Tissierella praeacuta TaxID=43131 RepID=UPI00333FF68F
MEKILSALLMILIIINSSISYGEDIVGNGVLNIKQNLRSYILADFETGEILEGYNVDEVIEMASISKLMSYLVIMDEVSKRNISLNDIVIIDNDTTRIKGSSFNLEVGEKFTLKELIEASIVVSGNDATYALAKYIAGTEEDFVKMMNQKAKELGFENARFYNSTGLPIKDRDIQNKMSTREIYRLTQHIIKNYPEILDISRIRSIEVISRDYFQRNTNPLLNEIEGIDGLKTGFTNKAGYCYVSTLNIKGKDSETKDLRLIAIVMGVKSLEKRNILSKILVEYGINNYSNKIFLNEELPLKTLKIPNSDIEEVGAFAEKGFSKLIKNDEDIEVNLDIDGDINLPIAKDTKIGKAIVTKEGEVIFESDILIKEDVNKAKWYMLVGRFFHKIFNMIGGFFVGDPVSI